ncbi:hypothetical protein Nepgr_014241 [Nepenthes gracilis]|uniref:RING-type E3 ubiquitin transferase n=1 Tax=Nepenthes gracilis TaxID=150966 RepID=A0AAD3SKB1_NEPGR|nr:hypothetical protein Nepgr_014241 [Nepenthes gracilis]
MKDYVSWEDKRRDMDEYPSRRTGGSIFVTRKGSSVVLRDSTDNKDRNAQICSRIGCSSKLNSPNGSGKDKSSRHSFGPSATGKEIIGSSSRTFSDVNSPRKSCSDSHRELSSQLETDSDTSSLLDESEVLEPVLKLHEKTQSRLDPKLAKEAASSSSLSHSRLGKKSSQRFGVSNQGNTPLGSFMSEHTNHKARNGASSSRYNIRNLRCNAISDVVPTGCSSSESSFSRKRDMGRQRTGEADSSLSARGKKISGPLLNDERSNNPNHGISISDSRRDRNLTPGRDNDVISVRTRWSARARLYEQENRNRLTFTESPIMTPLLPQPHMPFDASAQSSYNHFTVPVSSNCLNSSSRPGSSSENFQSNRPVSPHQVGIAHSFMNGDSSRLYNLSSIAEVLLALERIEQDEELTYEQLLVMETNLFLGGLAFHDQHRDMRLDIDDMSYEELLALEERMGIVSTALTEEELEKCLKRSIYQAATAEAGAMDFREDNDGIKCSICQEEYSAGEEVGRLGCDHRFHVDCIHQWLRWKNWCPICKATVAPLPSIPPS